MWRYLAANLAGGILPVLFLMCGYSDAVNPAVNREKTFKHNASDSKNNQELWRSPI